ncbi:OPT oligopeptide transporter protein-domain-containing protein [Polychytrium aggregatum]|uniref:OPT oligopeptide transporter protein-domain-containing protein n=1 Tax=Polychytrium aggregatum TaxID=110093 RepID=UPI0022FEDED7|nr:OPT oligopeptide transporter protein-domain-containing protein [Polychytrium aggregatum]KAI9203608.1 OPT oligopeptide transporter protein-domain-containing protein [Polychytrium aggregatum]
MDSTAYELLPLGSKPTRSELTTVATYSPLHHSDSASAFLIDSDDDGIDDVDPERTSKSSHGQPDHHRHGQSFDYTRSVVPQTDDPSVPALTVRAVFLGLFWSVLLCGMNGILMFRTNAITLSNYVGILLSYPMGLALAKVLPSVTFKICGYPIPLNPGPFSIKEHALIYVMTASAALPYGIDNVVVQKGKLWMNNEQLGLTECFLFVFATQFVGIGLAGLGRTLLVKPTDMFWPSNLSIVALFTSFHHQDDFGQKFLNVRVQSGLTRYQFFWAAFACMFAYTWIPEYFAQTLQMISVLCLFGAGKGSVLNTLGSGGYSEGVGMMTLSLDWNYIGTLIQPLWATLSTVGANVIWSWVIAPLVYYTNAWHAMEIGGCHRTNGTTGCGIFNSPSLFNGTDFRKINVLDLYDPTTFDLNLEVYERSEPIYITSTFAVGYGASFMSIAAVLSHVYLWYSEDVFQNLRVALSGRSKAHHRDIHNQLMEQYDEVPDWIYFAFFAVCSLLMIYIGATTSFEIPWWAVLLAIFMGIVFLIPVGTIQAVSGIQIGLNVITEFVIGLLIPGKTIAVMAFKSLGFNTLVQACSLLSDLKLGHYLHIAPTSMFAAQCLGSLVSVFVGTGFSWLVLEHFSQLGKGDWRGTQYYIFYSAGSIWGAIGPRRFFGFGSVYSALLWCFPAGLLLPFVPYLIHRYWHRNPFWSNINVPILCNMDGVGGNQVGVLSPMLTALVFQHYCFRYCFEWWKKYNYILAAALDSGLASALLVIAVLHNVLGVQGPVWVLNPDTYNGTQIDYYCGG